MRENEKVRRVKQQSSKDVIIQEEFMYNREYRQQLVENIFLSVAGKESMLYYHSRLKKYQKKYHYRSDKSVHASDSSTNKITLIHSDAMIKETIKIVISWKRCLKK